jgi:hypothetical protein
MMPEVENHHHHHPPGQRRIDWILPVCALFVSVVSLILAVIHGQAMERMADANARLVQTNSWPFLQYITSNEDDHGNARLTMGVMNSGVGPAKIESFEVFWNGKPVKGARELLAVCCGLKPGDLPSVGDASGTVEQQIAQMREAARSGLSSSQMQGVMQAHEGQNFVTLPLTERSAPVFHALNAARLQIKMRACYCSVFDECWISDLSTMRPQRVETCPKPAVPFGG